MSKLTWRDVDAAKAGADSSLLGAYYPPSGSAGIYMPPGYYSGLRLSISDEGYVVIGPGVIEVSGKQVISNADHILEEAEYYCKQLPNSTYYIYIDIDSKYRVYVLAPEWSTTLYSTYHPQASYRYVGKIITGTTDRAGQVINAPASEPEDINVGAVTTQKIVDDAITYAKVAANAIDVEQIVADAVTNAKIADNAVDTIQIVNDAIELAKMAADSVGTSQIVAEAVTTVEILARTILAGDIATGTLTANEIAAGTITASEIAAGTILTSNLNVLAHEKINNVTVYGHLGGWGNHDDDGTNNASTALSVAAVTYNGQTVNAARITDDGNYSVVTKGFAFDHTKIYKLSFTVMHSGTDAQSFYCGIIGEGSAISAAESDGPNSVGTYNWKLYPGNTRTLGAAAANQYMVSNVDPTAWTTYTVYIVGLDADETQLPNMSSSERAVKADDSRIKYAAIRWLNWGNAGTSNTTDLVNVSLTEYGGGTIVAENILADTITANEINVSAINALIAEINQYLVIAGDGSGGFVAGNYASPALNDTRFLVDRDNLQFDVHDGSNWITKTQLGELAGAGYSFWTANGMKLGGDKTEPPCRLYVAHTLLGTSSDETVGSASIATFVGTTTPQIEILDSAGTPGASRLAFSAVGDLEACILYFQHSTGQFNLGVGSTNVFVADETRLYSAVPMQFPDGSAAAPAVTFFNETDIGVFRGGAYTWAVATAGVQRFEIDNNYATITLSMRFPAGIESAPAITSSGDTNTGIYWPAADTLAISTAGTEKMRISSTATVINETSLDMDFRVESNGNANMLYVDGGTNQVGIGMVPSYGLDVTGNVRASSSFLCSDAPYLISSGAIQHASGTATGLNSNDAWYRFGTLYNHQAAYTYNTISGTLAFGYGGGADTARCDFIVYYRNHNSLDPDNPKVRYSYTWNGGTFNQGVPFRVVRTIDAGAGQPKTYELQFSFLSASYGTVHWDITYSISSRWTVTIDTNTQTSAADIGGQTARTGDFHIPGLVLSSDGAAALPAYGFIGDTNTGMYRKAADTIAFATAGVERMNIASVINTTVDLQVTGDMNCTEDLDVGGDATIDGQLEIGGASRFSARRATTQSMVGGAVTPVVFNSEDYDNLTEYNTSTGEFTSARAGYYIFDWMVQSASNSWTAGAVWITVLQIDTGGGFTTVAEGYRWSAHAAFSGQSAASLGTHQYYLAAGHKARISLYNNSSTRNTYANDNYVWFQGHRLS